MNILAIDTVTPVLSVTASSDSNGTITISVASGGQHAERMLEAIDQAANLAGFDARDTELVACAEGPGSFTGLRLAFSAAKAIAMAADCPLVPVPTLPCYASPFAGCPGCVISVLDAKKNRFYAQVFRRGQAVTEALDIDERAIMEYVDVSERIFVVGPDAELFSEKLTAAVPALDVTPLPSAELGISAELIKVAKNYRQSYTENVPDYAGPIYVRKSDAEDGRKNG